MVDPIDVNQSLVEVAPIVCFVSATSLPAAGSRRPYFSGSHADHRDLLDQNLVDGCLRPSPAGETDDTRVEFFIDSDYP